MFMLSEIFGDPLGHARDVAFIEALQRYVADGHPITPEDSTDTDTPPTMTFRLLSDVFDRYLCEQGLPSVGDDRQDAGPTVKPAPRLPG